MPNDVLLPSVLEAIDEPHPDHGGWHNFLHNQTDVRDQHEGVTFFGAVNCNYIVFPSGYLVQNYGYHGRALMVDIREKGVDVVEAELRRHRKDIKDAMEGLKIMDVVMVPDSTIGEFDFGEFRGHASRQEARPKRWDGAAQEMKPAKPAHWCVTVYGVDKAWRDVTMPLKRGRTLRHAIIRACEQFQSPEDIKPDKHGYFGSTIELKE